MRRLRATPRTACAAVNWLRPFTPLPLPILSRVTCRAYVLLLLCAAGIPSSKAAKIVFATYFSDMGRTAAGVGEIGLPASLAVDSEGSSYVAGTRSNIISRPGREGGTSISFDARLIKVSASGAIVYSSTVPGGRATGVALDKQGNAYLAGFSDFSGTVAATAGAFQTTGGPGFVAKFNPAGEQVWVGLLNARPTAIATDERGDVYVTGAANGLLRTTVGTLKTQIGFPRCPGTLGRVIIPCDDAFAAKISSNGAELLYSTFLGGTWEDFGLSIAVHTDGSAYVVGETLSHDFPITSGAFQTSYGGTLTHGSQRFGDAFAVRIDPIGRSLVYSTFLGGSGVDSATGVAVDTNGNAIVAGTTQSEDFPVTSGAFQPTYGGGSATPMRSGDAFYLKLDDQGKTVWASYLGGTSAETSGGVVLGADHRIYIGVGGPLEAGLERRFAAPCGESSAVVAVDADHGTLLGLRSLPASYGGAGLAIGPDGLVHVAVPGDQGDPDLVSTGPDHGYGAGDLLLARIDFSRETGFGLACVTDAANRAVRRPYRSPGAYVSPGEIISLFGSGLGPREGVRLEVDGSGDLPVLLGGLQVKMGEQSLPLLYVQDRQVNAVVPFHVSAGKTALSVEREGFQAGPIPVEVVRATPGIFTLDGSGAGQAAVLNEDGTVNSAVNPAARGSIVSFFATGFGAVTPLPEGTAMTPLLPPWPRTVEPFDLYIAGDAPNRAAGMEVLYAGPAPGAVPGLFQINARIPMNAFPGNTLFRFVFDPATGYERTQDNVYISIR